MKKNVVSVLLLLAALTLNTLGDAGKAAAQFDLSKIASVLGGKSETAQNVVGVLGSLFGNSTAITKADLIGTWSYLEPDCRFETEDLLKKAGGEIASKKVEDKLAETFAKFNIKQGCLSYTFNEDGTYSMVLNKKTIKGKWTFDENTRVLTIQGTLGLAKSNAVVCKNGTNISLLYDADKLLTLVTTIGSKLNSSMVKSISSLLASYDGMKVGFVLSK